MLSFCHHQMFISIFESISEAWTEQTEQAAAMATRSDSDVTSPLSPGQPDNKHSFFLTDRQMSRSLDFNEHDLTQGVDDTRGGCGLVGMIVCSDALGDRNRGYWECVPSSLASLVCHVHTE